MSHSVQIALIVDQIITLCGKEINIHDVQSIVVDEIGYHRVLSQKNKVT